MIKELVKTTLAVGGSLGADFLVLKTLEKYLPRVIDVTKLTTAGRVGVMAGTMGLMVGIDGFVMKGVEEMVDQSTDALRMMIHPKRFVEEERTKAIKKEFEDEVAEDAKYNLYKIWMEEEENQFTKEDMEKYEKYREKWLKKSRERRDKIEKKLEKENEKKTK